MKSEKKSLRFNFFKQTLVLVGLCFFTLTSCDKNAGKQILADRIAKMEANSNNPGKSPESVLQEIDAFQKDYDELFVKYDKMTTWYKALGMRYMDKGAYREAYNAFHEAAVRSGMANYWRLAANCAVKYAQLPNEENVKKYNYENAIECYEQALVEDPNHIASLKELGSLYTNIFSNGKKAVPYLVKASELSTKDNKILLDLGQAYYQIGEKEKAVETYDIILSRISEDVVIRQAQIDEKKMKENPKYVPGRYENNPAAYYRTMALENKKFVLQN